MSWRKLLVRGLVFSVLAGCGVAVALYHHMTDPAAVRAKVVDKLQELFPGANVSLDSARLHVFGGIALGELRLTRRDDPDQREFLHVPGAVIYHDREHLLDGKLAFRKVVLTRPRLRVERDRDGRWNLGGLIGDRTSAGEALPTLIVEQGTLLVEDRLAHPGMAPLEIHDLNLTVLSEAPGTASFAGSGISDVLGAVQLRGGWDRAGGAATCAVQVTGMPLTALLVQRVAAFCPNAELETLQLGGVADFKAEVDYRPGSGRPFSYDAHVTIHRGKVQHARLPLPVENLEMAVRCANGVLIVERLTADSGATRFELLKGIAQLPHVEQDFEVSLSAHHFPLGQQVCPHLPEGIKKLHEMFRPNGPATVTVQLKRQAGQWLQQLFGLYPEGISLCYTLFKYPTHSVTGSVEYDALAQRTNVHVKGYAGAQPVTLQGFWQGFGLDTEARLEITATGIPLDTTLLKALPPGLKATAESFHAVGRGDGTALIVRTRGVETAQCSYRVQFRDTSVRWNYFPLLLEKITGFLDVYPDRHWVLRDCRGTHNGGEVVVAGGSVPRAPGQYGDPSPRPPPRSGEGEESNSPPLRFGEGAGGRGSDSGPERLILDIAGKDIALDADLRQAVHARMEGLGKAWDAFSPRGRFSFAARVDRVPGREDDLDVAVQVGGCSIAPSFFQYTLEDLAGQFRYHKDRLVVTRVTARHGPTRLSLAKATVDLYRGGAFYAELDDLVGNPVLPDADLIGALPDGMRAACKAMELRDPFAVKTRLVIYQSADPATPPDIYWNGRAWLHKAKLQLGVEVSEVSGEVGCLGRHNGRQLLGVSGNALLERATLFNQPFHDVHARLMVDAKAPEVLVVALRAPIFGGDISGQARLDYHTDPMKFELNLTGSQIQLDEFGRHNFGDTSKLSGIAALRLFLTGKDTGIASLEGNGSIDVPYTTLTRLYNLPLLLDLLKFLNLRWPDRTAFEEAHAVFSVHGDRADIARLDLLGNVISLWGRGDVKLDGSDIKLDFYPSWARVEQILPPLVRSIPPAISKNLMKIEVRGKVTGNAEDLKFHKKPVPGLVDPLLSVRDLMTGKKD